MIANCAKAMLPKTAKRFILLNILGHRRRYEHLRSQPSRLFMDRELMPWVGRTYERVLFVGPASYTRQFERMFRRSRGQYTTIDPVKGTAVWGARNHIIAPIQEIGLHRAAHYFDCIIFNGVFGFGVNEIEEQRKVIKSLYEALSVGGLLVVGWNTNLMPDIEELGLFAPYFEVAEPPPWGHRTRFSLPETHVIDFYRRRAA